MERYTKRIICICLCTLIVALNIKVARAEAIPDVMCASATVADCVMSYYAMSGAAVANTDWINTLYNDLGSNFGTIYDFAENGMLTLNGDGTWQATTALETAIENAPAYQSLGLDQVFNISAQEAANGGGYAAAAGGSILGGALGCTASTGVLPLLGGVTAAYWGGIAIGTLVNHLVDKYKNYIQRGATIDTANSLMQQHPDFYVNTYKNLNNQTQYIFTPPDCRTFGCNNYSSNYLDIYCVNPTNTQKIWYYSENGSSRTRTCQAKYKVNLGNIYKNYTYNGFNLDYSNLSILDEYANGTRVLPSVKSPDLIGENGNLEVSEDNGNITVPDMLPQIDPSVQSGQPLSLQDWLNFANSAHQNTSTGALPDNSALFDNILSLVKKAIPNPSPNPNPNPNPDPYTPPNPTPSPDPDYDPNPDNPNQPDYESEREGQTEPVPDSISTGAPWITDGLLDKFPFCIPKDMIDMVKNFSSGTRQAPYISWRFNPPNTPVDYTFNLDLSDFEEIATLLRLLELGVFIVGLAFATRYLIGAA